MNPSIPLPANTLDRVLEVGQNQSQPIVLSNSRTPIMVIPEKSKIASLADYVDKPAPQFVSTVAQLHDVDSFAEYVNRYKTPATLICVDVGTNSAAFQAVFDYHLPSQADKTSIPMRCAHKAAFTTLQTPDFKAWLAADRQDMPQLAFASWLEDHQHLFITPDSNTKNWPANKPYPPSGANLLEFIQDLHGKQDVKFSSGIRLKSGGNSLNFSEDVELKTNGGTMELPDMLMAGVQPFLGAPAYQITARLKYRIESRKLMLRIETVQLEKVVRDAILLSVQQVAEKTGIVPLLGQL